jgi:hypothetical protein
VSPLLRSAPARLLLWCAAGTALVQLVLWRAGAENRLGMSPAFWYLLKAYDAHGNLLLLALAVAAFLLRRHPVALAAVRFCGERPWGVAALLFPALCLGSHAVYHAYPLSMDEYAAVFQARIFAAGAVAGSFPPDLIDWLIPSRFQNVFLNVSRATGEVSSTYWPGFALVLTPFTWLGVPWAANPAIGALSVPVIHRLAREIGGTREAAGWAVALTLASPVFLVASVSFYSMPAHLLANSLYALLLVRPTPARCLGAGLLGSAAMMLHQPVPHLLFALPFAAWLLLRPASKLMLLALVAGYVPLVLLLGVGWHSHLMGLAGVDSAVLPQASPAMVQSLLGRFEAILALPQPNLVEARNAGLSKVRTWGAVALVVLAAYGFAAARATTAVRLLGAALLLTVLGYFFFPQDQGHGWGYRYAHSAWFVLPVLAALGLAGHAAVRDGEMQGMVAWGIVFSMVLANGLRFAQVESFIGRHLSQVPLLAVPAQGRTRELVFVDIGAGFYTQDMIHNDPFLRDSRIVLVHRGREADAELAARRFPGFAKSGEGAWGERWTREP